MEEAKRDDMRMEKRKKRRRQIRIRIFLFFLVLAGIVVFLLFGPSFKRLAPKEYYEQMMRAAGQPVSLAEDERAVVLQDHICASKARIYEEHLYLDYEMVRSEISSRFFLDEENQAMLFTNAYETLIVPFNSAQYEREAPSGSETVSYGMPILLSDERGMYLSADFLQEQFNAVCTPGEEGWHVMVEYKWGERLSATAGRAVNIRTRGSWRGAIIGKTTEGETLTVLEEGGRWSRIATAQGLIGYVPASALSDVKQTQVTRTFEAGEYPSLTMEEPVNMVWHRIDNMDVNDYLKQDTQEMTGVNVISPTWFSLADNEGNITSLASKTYVRKAHKMGLQVWGLVSNFQPEVSTTGVVSSTKARKALVQNLIGEAEKCSMDGINVDLEAITADGAAGYVQLIRELSVACRDKGLVLSVDVPVPFEYNLYYDRAELGTVADYVIMMGYDEHYVGSEAGSVASLAFEENGISRSLGYVPAAKLISAVPFYARIWYTQTDESGQTQEWSEAWGMSSIAKKIEEAGAQITWNEETGQNYAEWTPDDNTLCRVWIEDETSLAKKAELVKTYGLGGIAAWALGFERASVWEVLSDALGGGQA